MFEVRIRASSLGRLMAEPTAAARKAGEVLSAGAKALVRELAAQAIFGVEFEVDSKAMQKGRRCELEALALVSRVRGLALVRNTERRSDDCITGECDAIDGRAGWDVKCAWSAATFPLLPSDGRDSGYEWQARAYMRLWGADRWHVAHVLLDTPEDLIGWESQSMHFVSHLPEHHRLTVWTVERDPALEAAITERVRAAQAYYREVLEEFERTHQEQS